MISHRLHATLLVAILLALAGGGSAGTVAQPGVPKPIEVRLQVYLGDKPEGLVPEASWVVACQGKQLRMHIRHIDVLTGDVSPSNIITDATPYRITFHLRGDPALLRRLAAAGPNQLLTLTGFFRTGSRQFLLSAVDGPG